MYELKALQPQFNIQLPTCMYEMKNVSLAVDACGHVSHEGIDQVCVRQEKVLQQLYDLKKQLVGIRSTLGLCQKGVQHTKQKPLEPLHDIVINSNPNFIPYGLLALKNVWKNSFTIDVKTFTHSTLPDIGAEARLFEQQLRQVPVDITNPKINVTLIWKACDHTEMISSPTMYVPIYGEVNIIRYLGRVGPADYESAPSCNEIDAVLDISYQLLRCPNQNRANLLRLLNQRLQKKKFFGGDEISIADAAVSSSIKQMSITEKELTPALSAWQKRVQLVTQI